MRVKITLSSAWAERLKFSDDDLRSLFDIPSPESAVVADGNLRCPRCRNERDDSNFHLYTYPSAAPSPEADEGRCYVGCVCGTTYYFNILHRKFFGVWPPTEAPPTM